MAAPQTSEGGLAIAFAIASAIFVIVLSLGVALLVVSPLSPGAPVRTKPAAGGAQAPVAQPRGDAGGVELAKR